MSSCSSIIDASLSLDRLRLKVMFLIAPTIFNGRRTLLVHPDEPDPNGLEGF